MLPNDQNSAYYFILRKGKLFFVIFSSIFEAAKELYTVRFLIYIYTSIGKQTIHIS